MANQTPVVVNNSGLDAEDDSRSNVNPWQAPISAPNAKTRSHRPHAGDWFVAILLAFFAVAFMLPVTCVGTVVVLDVTNFFTSQWHTIILLITCVTVSVLCGSGIARSHLSHVRRLHRRRNSELQ